MCVSVSTDLKFGACIKDHHISEEVIFSVASVCVCVSVSTDLKFGACIKDHHISDKFEGRRSRSKVLGQSCLESFVPH